MKEQIMKIFHDAMSKMFQCTADMAEGMIPANEQFKHSADSYIGDWSVGYNAGYESACRFLAGALRRQAERFEQSELMCA